MAQLPDAKPGRRAQIRALPGVWQAKGNQIQMALRGRTAARGSREKSPSAPPAPPAEDRLHGGRAGAPSRLAGEHPETEAATEFDEEWYLYSNKDVARAVEEGRGRSGLQHYLSHGRREGRSPLPPPDWDRQMARRETADRIDPSLGDISARHRGEFYLAPVDLAVAELPLQRVAVIGSCLAESWGFHKNARSACPVDMITLNNVANLPPQPPDVVKGYDFQIVQLPLRSALPDATLWRLPYDDIAGHESAFETACRRVDALLDSWMAWNVAYGLLSFVSNFFVPQQNLMGRLVPRFDLRNPEYFVDKLNEHLERSVGRFKNAYVLDVDRISASFGRRFIQDDSVHWVSHASVMGAPGVVTARIEPLAPFRAHYEVRELSEFRRAVWNEIICMYRTVRQADGVKMVALDLDDTLWQGVSGDAAEIGSQMVEGWPLGLAEALLYLKKRGVLLAIVSKNDEQRIRAIWPKIFVDRLRIEDFAAVRINWRPKPENMREILEVVNVLPRSVVFLDDHPAERAAMARAFPEMRILGRHPYYLRRILLWSAETQVPFITGESARRTEMVQAQFTRESRRTGLSRDDFLREAAPRVTLSMIADTDHPRFKRALELINKTNQFNTTGKRWRAEDCGAFFGRGKFYTFEVEDRFTNYGLVGVVVMEGGSIVQWVMSCRVLGYQVEEAVMATLVGRIRSGDGAPAVTGELVETEVNFPCRDLFDKCGFRVNGDRWALNAETPLPVPAHVSISWG
ncbi:MAG TPA: HAD-IIIC family phosphatase [Stellaceae bacterium]|nr:HAD-IIIC family phosphatase [Stellaceae bacterium]